MTTKSNITLFIVGLIIALIGAYMNPMNWYENFKGTPSIFISLMAGLTIFGTFLMGYSMRTLNIPEPKNKNIP